MRTRVLTSLVAAAALVAAALPALAAAPAGVQPAGAKTLRSVFGRAYDTLRNRLLAGATVEIVDGQAVRRTTVDAQGQFWFKDVPAGGYIVVLKIEGHGDVIGRLLVSAARPVTIADLDLSKLEAPDEDDHY